MCLAIYRPRNRNVSIEHLRNGFAANSDGAGFAVAVRGKLLIRKGFFTFDAFHAALAEHEGKPALIHFRLATHGRIGESNCHPFLIAEDRFALIHNGILDIESTPDESDTATFARRVLGPVLATGVNPAASSLRYLVETSIGAGNKVAVMDGKGNATIYNESAGLWEGGVWFSNSSHKRRALCGLDDWDWREIEARQIMEDEGFIAPEDAITAGRWDR